jgi:hypothetical protein
MSKLEEALAWIAVAGLLPPQGFVLPSTASLMSN